ncbi:peptidase M50 [Mycolicibacterium komossense]|uniref:Peptidase M50 n=1 Tax=Mycolicibacterium komossense TaxID=1779 RepID=A0ABT3CKP6_9MYCO|nr:peptidase M50 [Mycolicibacterium komossense]MCV7230108.1 peptidase M50 [Mycolicibacterium komossense]
MADPRADIVALLFSARRLPRALTGLPVVEVADPTEIDAASETARRLIVVGADSDLAAVLTRLLRTERLAVEVAHVSRRTAARTAQTGAAQRVPLIRDETGQVLVGAAYWLPTDEARTIHGEGVVDDTVLFDGDVAGVLIEPIPTVPGLRARLLTSRLRPRRWVAGRAAQLGTTGAIVVRDGVPASRVVRRSTFYRHTEGWLRVS